MASHHSVSRWFCSTCSFGPDNNRIETIYSTESDYRAHMLEQHNNSFMPLDLPLLIELAERSTVEPTSCPLCINDRNLVLVDHDDHIAKHLHSFYLRALPWDFDLDEGAASAGSGDSAPGPGPQPFPDEEEDDAGSDGDAEGLGEKAKNVWLSLEQLLFQHPDCLEKFGQIPHLDTSQLGTPMIQSLLSEVEG